MIQQKKTPRTPKPTAPAIPPAQSTKADRPVTARRRSATPKADAAKPVARRVAVTRRIRPVNATPAPTAVQPAVAVSADDIRTRAYFLSLKYRGSDRNDVDFWLVAERELRGSSGSAD